MCGLKSRMRSSLSIAASILEMAPALRALESAASRALEAVPFPFPFPLAAAFGSGETATAAVEELESDRPSAPIGVGLGIVTPVAGGASGSLNPGGFGSARANEAVQELNVSEVQIRDGEQNIFES